MSTEQPSRRNINPFRLGFWLGLALGSSSGNLGSGMMVRLLWQQQPESPRSSRSKASSS